MKVAEDHGKQKAAFYAGINVGQEVYLVPTSLVLRDQIEYRLIPLTSFAAKIFLKRTSLFELKNPRIYSFK